MIDLRMEQTIVIFDDNEELGKALQSALEAHGIPAAWYASPALDPVAIVLDEHASLISMDVTMPGMDGLEAGRMLKADERTKRIPLVYYTNIASERQTGLGLGALEYFSKWEMRPEEYAAFLVRMVKA